MVSVSQTEDKVLCTIRQACNMSYENCVENYVSVEYVGDAHVIKIIANQNQNQNQND